MFNPYTWTSQITKPERNEITISCTQNYETSTGIAIPTSSHLTHKLISLHSFSFFRSSPHLALKLSLRPSKPKTNDSTSINYYKTSTSMNMAGFCNFLTKFSDKLSHLSLPILHMEKVCDQ